jgi:hypothetical protein
MALKRKSIPSSKPARTVTADEKNAWLGVYAATGSIVRANRMIGITERVLGTLRKNDPDFEEAMFEAKNAYVDGLEAEADRRAIEGVVKPVYYRGVRVDNGEVRDFSDTLLIFRLKAERPEKYRENIKAEQRALLQARVEDLYAKLVTQTIERASVVGVKLTKQQAIEELAVYVPEIREYIQ